MAQVQYETLICKFDGHEFERPVRRGVKPSWCDAHRMGGAKPSGKPEAKPEAVETPEPDSEVTLVHVNFEKVLRICQTPERLSPMLFGPAGSGKTVAGRMVSEAMGIAFYPESCNPMMTKWDLLGFVGPNGNYVPGVIFEAFRDGGVVLLDEVDASNPALLLTINAIAALKPGETWRFPNGEIIARHANFVLIVAGNTNGQGADENYVGREQMDASTPDRFVMVEWGYDERLEFRLGQNDEWVRRVQEFRMAVAVSGAPLLITPRASINGAALLRAGFSRAEVEDMVIWKGCDETVRRTVKAAVRQARQARQAETEPATAA